MKKLRNININKMNQLLNNERYLILLSIIVILLYMFPLLFFWERTEVVIYDNLDIVIPLLKILAKSGKIFASSNEIIPNMMGGLPRFLYGSEWNVYLWLVYFFGSFPAYVINEVLMHTTGFLSMLILLKKYIVPSDFTYRNLLIYAISVLYGLIAFYTGAGLSVPLLPLVLYAFLNIRSGKTTFTDWLIIVLTPFYSSIILVYSFVILFAGSLFIYDWIRHKKFNKKFFAAIVLMTIIFGFVEYRLVGNMFFSENFISHRVEFKLSQSQSFMDAYRNAHRIFLNGLKNMPVFYSSVIIPTMLTAFILTLIPSERLSKTVSVLIVLLLVIFIVFLDKNIKAQIIGGKYFLPLLASSAFFATILNKKYKAFYLLILLQIFISYWYAAWYLEITNSLSHIFPIIKQYNFARVNYLMPLIWFVIFTYALIIIGRKIYFFPLLLLLLFIFQWKASIITRQFKAPKSPLSYHSYYAPELFEKIKKTIGEPVKNYRVGNLGIEPAISLYNGLHTIDGYIPNYPLAYKKSFYHIIEKALKTKPYYKKMYLEWGSKCYLFDGDQPWLLYNPQTIFHEFNLNLKAFYDLGGRYLISSRKIENFDKKGLLFLKKFTDENTFWHIYLYKIVPPMEIEEKNQQHDKK